MTAIPPNSDGNLLYMVHFPPGLTIIQNGQASCRVFCGYHGTFKHGAASAKNPQAYHFYAVMPDPGGACAGGCGTAPTELANLTSVASHELVEAITDPAVGFATTYAAPLAWYDPQNGEIGDICNAQQGEVAGYTVQSEWSNATSACVKGNVADCKPVCEGKICGDDDGCGGRCGNSCLVLSRLDNSLAKLDALPKHSSLSGQLGPNAEVSYAIESDGAPGMRLRLSELSDDCDLSLRDAAGATVQTSARLGRLEENILLDPLAGRYQAISSTEPGCTFTLERTE